MARYLLRRIIWIICFAIVSYSFPVTDENDAALYLKNFGYIEESTGGIIGQVAVSSAIKDFQNFAGLSETGELDDETIAKMNMPRCGVKDKIRHSARRRRYTLDGRKWPLKELTYHISKYPSTLTDNTIVKNEIARAFKLWSDVTPLTFKEKLEGQANIDIQFEGTNHRYRCPFIGNENTLAHAFLPQNGDAHFDDEETWTINESYGINLFQVAGHEFGHSLGLLHSHEQQAIMTPFYTGYIPGFQLHSDDVEGIQVLYGSRDTPDKSDAPDLCQDATIDTIARTESGSTYVFKGDFYWKVLPNGLAEGYPRKISDDWGGLPGNLDASVTWRSIGKTYFFKGTHYWRFSNKNMDRGYPKLISDGWKGIPDSLDAALVWSVNGKTYFFKGNQYWRFDYGSRPPVSTSYPLSITLWSGLLADGIDAAFQSEINRTYFFKGGHYYRYNDITSKVDDVSPPYPRSTALWWFRCL